MASKVNASSERYHKAKGRIHSVLRQYGFVDVNLPSVQCRVYFNNRVFEENRHADLPSSGIKVGDRVVLDFFQRPGTSRYQASSVCRQGYVPQRSAEELPQRFDDEDGFVCVLKDSHAFVRVSRFRDVTASFQKSDFEAYAGRRVATLSDVIELGIKVRFDAERNPDERSKTKWIIERLRFVDGVPPATAATVVRSCSSEDDGDVALAPKLFAYRGSVEKVVSDHAIVRCHSRTAYLHASTVEECLGVDVEDLRKVLEEGTEVRFDAGQKGRQYGRGGWCVTRVEILSWSSDTSQPVASHVAAEEAPSRPIRTGDQVSDVAADAELHELQLERRLRINGNNQDLTDDEEIEDGSIWGSIGRNVPDNELTLIPSLVSREELPSLPSHAPKDEPSVFIYQDVPAVVASVTASAASCIVERSDGTRMVNFAARCFYRDGVPVAGHLGQALDGGDLVTLDFMVGTTRDGGKVVHCGLAWQGKKPRHMLRMSVEEMLARLDASETEDEDAVGPDDQFLLETIDDDDLDALLGESSSTLNHDEADAAPTSRWRIRDDAEATGLRTVAPPKNGTQGTVNEESLGYLLTNNEVPVFARMILQQLATSHLPNSRVHLRHASTQTE